MAKSGCDLTVYPTKEAMASLILAHGAGAGQHSAFMVAAGKALAARGILTATFDFPYMVNKRSVPDKGPVLEDAWLGAIDAAVRRPDFADLPLFIGGKSMGGRIASQAAAAHTLRIGGLVYLGYPLHPPGKPGQRRDTHLPSIAVPMLFVQGSRDAFGTSEEIRELLLRLNPKTVLHEIPGADHSFKVPARGNQPQAAVMDGIYDTVAAFIRSVAPARG
jgi:hypothetical protein